MDFAVGSNDIGYVFWIFCTRETTTYARYTIRISGNNSKRMDRGTANGYCSTRSISYASYAGCKMDAKAFVDGKLAAEAQITAAIGDRPAA